MEARERNVGEEIANSISHGIGAAFGIAGLVLLTIRAATAGAGYSIPMIIEESRILQVSLFHTLQKNLRTCR